MVRGVLMILILLVFKFSIAQDYKRAPNSYIYDINYAEVYRYGGLQIPVIKAYHAWVIQWFSESTHSSRSAISLCLLGRCTRFDSSSGDFRSRKCKYQCAIDSVKAKEML